MNIDETIINNIQKICKQKNIKMYDMAKSIGQTNKKLARILKLESNKKLTIQDLEIISNFLNVDIVDLFEIKK